ncbi:GNAT family N-acetyltransferase [Paenibacillus aurantius]|uniref:GNAT family N-acetyltransferase n=1 Tax=Paenibacillus aurantius TaxID=2918900 RepID=A0AA96L8Q2_9BACL|nr:GNAT family N-acetyltransferase [Paenibacillus aurantius]WNQ08823.1 GNAT family N-acetyltransferase [Paenibacillus aurantius]
MIEIRKIGSHDIHRLDLLVEESVREGFRHLTRLVNEYASGVNRFGKDGEALFMAMRNKEVVGVCGGLNRDPFTAGKERGRVRRLYTSPSARRSGIGRKLMQAVMIEARKHYKCLTLKTDNPAADAFYRSLGFQVISGSDTDTHVIFF